jgi:hypothetical protein
MKTFSMTLAVLILTGPAIARAQTCPAPNRSGGAVVRVVVPGYGCGGRQWHAATAAESYLRGQADVIRAQGQYNLLSSQAMINVTRAYRQHLDNQVKKTQTYFAMQRINQEVKAAKRAERRSRYLEASRSAASKMVRNAPLVLDSATGRIRWPAALRSDEYAAHRNVVDGLHARVNAGQALEGDARATLGQTVDRMLETLRRHVREIPGTDYAAAKRFLRELSYESLLHTEMRVAAVGP